MVLNPGWEFDGPQVYAHMVEFLPPYAWPRFLRIQVKKGDWGWVAVTQAEKWNGGWMAGA